MKASREGFYLHVGRGWADALADIAAYPVYEVDLEQLYAATAHVDIMLHQQRALSLPRVVRVLPFLLSFIDQLARAFDTPGTRASISDGGTVLDLQYEHHEVVLATEDRDLTVALPMVVAGLRRAVHELNEEIQELPSGAAQGVLARQLSLADSLLIRMDAPGAYRRRRHRRPLHHTRTIDRNDDLQARSFTEPSRIERISSLLDEPCEAERMLLPKIEKLRFLHLEHSFEAIFDSVGAQDIVFAGEQGLALLFRDRLVFVSCVSGLHYEVRLDDAYADESPRRLGSCIVVPSPKGLHALHLQGPWEVHSSIVGVRQVDELDGLVASEREALAYLRGFTVYDAPSGAALLHDVSELIPRLNAHHEVVGWYAIDRASQAIWWDGDGEVACLHTSVEPIVAAVGTGHGLVALVQGKRSPRLRWIMSTDEVGWQRDFETRGTEGYGHYRLQVWPEEDEANRLMFAVISGPIWWAFRVHTVTRLATLVLHHREAATVRLEVAAGVLVVASGARLRVYPCEGRAPEPLWEEDVPVELGLLAPVFPMHVRGDLIAYATSHAVVRNVRSGELLATYSGSWSAVFDLRLDEQLGLSVIGAVPGHHIELFRAEASHWLGVVPPPDA